MAGKKKQASGQVGKNLKNDKKAEAPQKRKKSARHSRRICIIHRSPERELCDELINELKKRSKKGGRSWIIHRHEIRKTSGRGAKGRNPIKISGTQIKNSAQKYDAIIYVHTEDSFHDALNYKSATDLEGILKGGKRVFVSLRLTDMPLPFGFPRGALSVNWVDEPGKQHFDLLHISIKEAFSKRKATIRSADSVLSQFWDRKKISNLRTAVAPFIGVLKTNPWNTHHSLYFHTAIYIFDWIAYLGHLNEASALMLTLRHSRKILDYLKELCHLTDATDGRSAGLTSENHPLDKIENRFLAMFGALLHNQPLHREIPGPEIYAPYSENAPRFLDRIESLEIELSRGLPEEPKVLLRGAFHLGIEMYRDSVYWKEGINNNPKALNQHERMLKRFKKHWPDYEAISIALRICDMLDVGHRSIPDLVRSLFLGAEYEQGRKCFFGYTFTSAKDFLFSKAPVLKNQQLQLTWPNAGKSKHLLVLNYAKAIIDKKLLATLNELKLLGRHPNLAVNIYSIQDGRVSKGKDNDIVWSFFPLAIEYPPSDSVAAKIAIEILPRLVSYIYEAKKEAEAPARTEDKVQELLDVFSKLRRNCHFLPWIVEIAKKAIEGKNIKNYGAAIRAAFKDELLKKPPYEFQAKSVVTDARNFLVFGVSQPVSEWLATLAEKLKSGESINITFMLCSRKLLAPSPSSKNSHILDKIPEHDTAKELLIKTLNERKIDPDKVRIDDKIWDFEKLPAQKWPRDKTELLFGARRLLLQNGKAFVVGNYGADLLSLAAKSLQLPVRVITGQNRFKYTISEFNREKRNNSFSISYSHLEDTNIEDETNTEDERIPFSQIKYITTETQNYTSAEAKAKLLKNKKAGKRKSSRGKHPREIVHTIETETYKPKAVKAWGKSRSTRKPIVIITANPVEYDVALSLAGVNNSQEKRTRQVNDFKYIDLGLGKVPVLICKCIPGSIVAGGSTDCANNAISHLKPDAIIVAGVAAGIQPGQNIGDILVSTHVKLYDPQRRGRHMTFSRGSKIPASPVLLNWFGSGRQSWSAIHHEKISPKISEGLILSGESLADDPQFIAELLKNEPEALGLEMEAAGVCTAVQKSGTKWIVVKSICDRGKDKSDDYQEIAAKNAFDFIYHTLTRSI